MAFFLRPNKRNSVIEILLNLVNPDIIDEATISEKGSGDTNTHERGRLNQPPQVCALTEGPPFEKTCAKGKH